MSPLRARDVAIAIAKAPSPTTNALDGGACEPGAAISVLLSVLIFILLDTFIMIALASSQEEDFFRFFLRRA